MTNNNMKFVKSVAALALSTSIITTAVVAADTTASAQTTYKVSKGKLVNAKTGKAVKGYVVYKSTLYYNGTVKKGYKTVGTGSSMKLYNNGKLVKGYKTAGSGSSIKLFYNGSLKKGYKTAAKGSADKYYLFYNGTLKKGYKTAGNGERLYKDGRLDNGYEVYGDVDKNPSLYYNGYLKEGYKTANKSTLLFYNGKLKEGYKTAKNDTVLYKEGRLNDGLVVVKDILFDGSKQNKGLKEFSDKTYFDAKLANGTYKDANGVEKTYKDGVEVKLGVTVVGADGVTPVDKIASGDVLTANIELPNGDKIGSYPKDPNVSYKWHFEGSDAVLGTDATFTITEDTVAANKKLVVDVTYKEETATWTSKAVATAATAKAVTVVGKDGVTPVDKIASGDILTANLELTNGDKIGSYPKDPNVSYKWHYEGNDAVLGTDATFTITDATVAANKKLVVDVTYKEGTATWISNEAAVPAAN
ncbi:hypothetical protein ACIQ4I_20410 [Rummeliibacillus sp. NPDC094406]|uniref:hypothetical protein n=1 Tax=Rummeliibacillus sp. NPDC094406 TaxID=3364511 RepID=UPI003829C2F1